MNACLEGIEQLLIVVGDAHDFDQVPTLMHLIQLCHKPQQCEWIRPTMAILVRWVDCAWVMALKLMISSVVIKKFIRRIERSILGLIRDLRRVDDLSFGESKEF